MHKFTLSQLRALSEAGGLLSVTLEAVGRDFAVKLETRRGDGILVKSNSRDTPRTFADPRKALLALRDELGVREAKIDARAWRPEQNVL